MDQIRTPEELRRVALDFVRGDSGARPDERQRIAAIASLDRLAKERLAEGLTPKQRNTRIETRIHCILRWCLDVASRSHMTARECSWLLDWIDCTKTEVDGRTRYIPSERAVTEALAIYQHLWDTDRQLVDDLMLAFTPKAKEEKKPEPAQSREQLQTELATATAPDGWNGDLGDGLDKYGEPIVATEETVETLFGPDGNQRAEIDQKML